jgi:hypothetical protein
MRLRIFVEPQQGASYDQLRAVAGAESRWALAPAGTRPNTPPTGVTALGVDGQVAYARPVFIVLVAVAFLMWQVVKFVLAAWGRIERRRSRPDLPIRAYHPAGPSVADEAQEWLREQRSV